MLPELIEERGWARDWLFDHALPFWWRNGADHELGGWFDKLDLAGAPVDLPKRLRVQARQIFVFAEAGRLGWNGPWAEATYHGLDFMLSRFKRPDGLFRASVDRWGAAVLETSDLYDQAFVLFALASGWAMLGRPEKLRAEADSLLEVLQTLFAHPEHGFQETMHELPLRSNPHMHMLEALLAWIEVGGGSQYEAVARDIVELALERLIDPRTGAIGEYYDENWGFAAKDGHLREPGHQFEWAYLLHCAARVLGGDYSDACARLHRFGTHHGVHNGRAVFSVDAEGAIVDGESRLWAQTERLRTMIALAAAAHDVERTALIAAAKESFATIRRFLDVPTAGLWLDRMDADGNPLSEPSPASTLYHIMTGLVPLLEDHQPNSMSRGDVPIAAIE